MSQANNSTETTNIDRGYFYAAVITCISASLLALVCKLEILEKHGWICSRFDLLGLLFGVFVFLCNVRLWKMIVRSMLVWPEEFILGDTTQDSNLNSQIGNSQVEDQLEGPKQFLREQSLTTAQYSEEQRSEEQRKREEQRLSYAKLQKQKLVLFFVLKFPLLGLVLSSLMLSSKGFLLSFLLGFTMILFAGILLSALTGIFRK